jgi:hypothetical protein
MDPHRRRCCRIRIGRPSGSSSVLDALQKHRGLSVTSTGLHWSICHATPMLSHVQPLLALVLVAPRQPAGPMMIAASMPESCSMPCEIGGLLEQDAGILAF